MQKNININDKNNEDLKDILEGKKTYFFSQDNLENYYNIYFFLDDYLNCLAKKNALNNIVIYGDLKYTYKIGFEHVIFLLKSYPFNILRLIYQRQYYKDCLRQFFIPYLRRAFNNINLYIYNNQRFFEVNKVIEQIYRIIFLKRLNFYGQIKQLYFLENEFIQNDIKEDNQISNNKNIVIKKDNINNNENSKKENDIKFKNEKMDLLIEILKLIYKKIVFTKLYFCCMNKETINKKNDNDILDKSNISSQGYNTNIYKSFSEKSFLTSFSNSEGSERLHKVRELFEMKRKGHLEDKNNNLSELSDYSIPSIESLDDVKYKKRNNSYINSNKKINNNLEDEKQEEKKLENLIKINEEKKQNEIKENLGKKIEINKNIIKEK